MKYISDNELQSFIGVTLDDNIRLIANASEEYILSNIRYLPTNAVTEEFSGPLSSVKLSDTYISSINSMVLNGNAVNPTYDLLTGEIYISLNNGDSFVVTYYPTSEIKESVITTSKYAVLSYYPVKYIVQVECGSSIIADYSLIGNSVIKLSSSGSYTVSYRAGDKLPNDIKLAILVLTKYWYRNSKENTFGIESYKVGDVSVKFSSSSAIPFEVEKIIEKYSANYISWFGGIV